MHAAVEEIDREIEAFDQLATEMGFDPMALSTAEAEGLGRIMSDRIERRAIRAAADERDNPGFVGWVTSMGFDPAVLSEAQRQALLDLWTQKETAAAPEEPVDAAARPDDYADDETDDEEPTDDQDDRDPSEILIDAGNALRSSIQTATFALSQWDDPTTETALIRAAVDDLATTASEFVDALDAFEPTTTDDDTE